MKDFRDTEPAIEITQQDIEAAELTISWIVHEQTKVIVSPQPKMESENIPTDLLKVS
jgi:hypothetical protein